MAILPILLHPDPRLKKISKPIIRVTDEICKLADDMLETMYAAPGIGLAAPQVGVSKRIFVMDCSEKTSQEAAKVYINPIITWSSSTLSTYEEGCLSIPDIQEEIERPEQVQIRYMDLSNNYFETLLEGIWATCAQHELDHLDGKLFIDYLGPIKRSIITNKMKKLKKEQSRKVRGTLSS